ncbi:Na/Pi cotransporter family protein [Thermodesulfobacteriota bacterium]
MITECSQKRIKVFLAAVLSFFIFTGPLYAAKQGSGNISWGFLIIGLLGGLALFLYGMEKMSDGMKKSAGNKMRSFLAALTRNRIIALLAGTFVTMMIQSSSATTVMLVSFVQAGLMGFVQSLGVVLGAGIGTTITAQLIAFKLTDYALLMIAIGFGMQMMAKTEKIKHVGEIILGFGILFYGMKLMSDAMKPLRTYPHFIDFMKGLENPMLGILVGTVFTALVQSSSASTGVVIVLAQQGLITLEAGIPIIFGANIGTCVTAGLASIGATREAKRVALAHVFFKIAGVMIFIFWIPGFAELIRTLAAKFGSDVGRQIANVHTIFNVSLVMIFLPLTTYVANFLIRVFPDKKETTDFRMTPWHLDEESISTPALAVDLARAEISRMAKVLGRMLRAIIIPFMSDEKLIRKEGLTQEETELLIKEIPKQDEFFPQLTLLEGIDMREEKIDFLDEKINEFLVQISRQGLDENQANEVYGMMSISNDMESIGDLIHRNLVPLIDKKRALDVDFSEEGKEELLIYHQKVCRQIDLLMEAFAETSPEKAKKIMAGERKYLDLESQYRIKHLERLRHKRADSIDTHEVHMELMDLLKQIIVYSSNIAKTFLLRCKPQ